MEGKKYSSSDERGIPSEAKRRRTRWGLSPGTGPSPPPEKATFPTKSNFTAAVASEPSASGPSASEPKGNEAPLKKTVNVQDILNRIGDVSSILSRARALKEASLVPKHATLKINKSLLDGKNNKQESATSFVDSRLKTRFNVQRAGAFKFVKKGYYMSKQRNLEKKLEARGVDTAVISRVIAALDAEQASTPAAAATNALQEFLGRRKHIKAVPMNQQAAQSPKKKSELSPPAVEPATGLAWWDQEVLKILTPSEQQARDARLQTELNERDDLTEWSKSLILAQMKTPLAVKDGAITHLVEHPEPVEPLIDTNVESAIAPVYLTRSERKRMRRQMNKEREQDKRDKIQMGLIDPPPPKVKLSNLMRVLGDTAVAKPTAVEASVRKQIAERQKAHEDRIAASRLSPEARRAKKIRQWTNPKETEEQVSVAIFKLKDITSKQCLFKVHQNAKDLHLTGTAALCPGSQNIVIVEGSSKAIKKYKAVMLRRIQWPGTTTSGGGKGDIISAAESGSDILDPFCVVVWEGAARSRSFQFWTTHPCSDLEEMEELFLKNNAEQYWKTIQRFRPAQADLL